MGKAKAQTKEIFLLIVILLLGKAVSETLDVVDLLTKCGKGDLVAVKQLMAQFGITAVLNARKSRNCLYMSAANNRDPSLLWFLLEKGADPDSNGDKNSQFTPLAEASYNGHTSNMEILLAHGADPKLFYSHALRESSNTDTFLDTDAQKYNTRLLLRHGADPNDKNTTQEVFSFKSSPFERAIFYKKLGAVREMAKWMETIPEGNYEEQIQKEIDGGQKERGQLLAVNECDSNPCHNGGTCVGKFDSFSCECPDGFNGTTCGNEKFGLCPVNGSCDGTRSCSEMGIDNFKPCKDDKFLRCKNNGSCSDICPLEEDSTCVQLNWFTYILERSAPLTTESLPATKGQEPTHAPSTTRTTKRTTTPTISTTHSVHSGSESRHLITRHSGPIMFAALLTFVLNFT